jgi:hypothetical protein
MYDGKCPKVYDFICHTSSSEPYRIEVMGVSFKNQIEHTKTAGGQNAELLTLNLAVHTLTTRL